MDSPFLIIFVTVFIGLAKGGVTGPIGGPLLLAILSQTMTVPEATGLTLPLLIIGDIFAMHFYWGEWDLKLLRLLLPAAVVGIVIGLLLLFNLPDIILRRILGIMTLLVLVYKLSSDRLSKVEYSHRDWHSYLAGGISGCTSVLANTGGPPMTAYLLLQKLNPTAFVGTMTLFFFIVNLVKLPGFFLEDKIDIPLLIQNAWALPLIPLAAWGGRRVIGLINRVWFERAMIIALLAASMVLLFR